MIFKILIQIGLLSMLFSCNSVQQSKLAKSDVLWQQFYELSGYEESQTLIIKDQKTWNKVQAKAFELYSPAPMLDKVDFAKDNIVLIAFGRRSTGGHTYSVKGYKNQNNAVEVVITSPKQAENAMQTQMITYPTLFFKIDKTNHNTVTYNIQPE